MVFKLLIIINLISFSNTYANEYNSVGTAAIEKKNVNLAKENAKNDALRLGLEKAISSVYESESVKSNEWVLRKKVYSVPSSFVNGYKDLEYNIYEKASVVEAKLTVIIDLDMLREKLIEQGIFLSYVGTNTILTLIYDNSGFSESVISSLAIDFSKKGFSFLDTANHHLKDELPNAVEFSNLSLEKILEIGNLFNVNLVANGYINTECKKIINEFSCTTNFYLKIVSVSSGKVLAFKNISKTENAKIESEARKISVENAVRPISESITSQLDESYQNIYIKFKVSIKGVNRYEEYKAIKDFLSKKLDGYESVVERYQASGLIVFEGRRKKDIESLKRDIISNLFKDLEFTVSESSNSLEIQIL